MNQAVKNIVLVTGGCGFVGRHLVKSLLEEGGEVWVLDNLFSGQHPDRWLIGFTKKNQGDYLVYEKNNQRLIFICQDAIDFFNSQMTGGSAAVLPRFGEVYHLAAIVGGRAVLIEENPILVATNHLIDSLFFMWAVRSKDKIGRILYISTSVSYPQALQDRGQHLAMKEEYLNLSGYGQIGLPESIYGWVKLAGEYLARVAAKKYGISVVCVRPFSGYGEDQDLSYPIPSIAVRAFKRENPLVVWGSGNQGRDFIYIDDFVSAMRLAIQKISDGGAVNIDTGQLTTFKEVAKIMAELVGYAPEIIGRTDKVEGSFAVYADPALLRSLGWRQKYTLQEGFAKILNKIKSSDQI